MPHTERDVEMLDLTGTRKASSPPEPAFKVLLKRRGIAAGEPNVRPGFRSTLITLH
jgi:hypothetical protein